MPEPVGPRSMLVLQYISLKPEKAQAQFVPKPALDYYLSGHISFGIMQGPTGFWPNKEIPSPT